MNTPNFEYRQPVPQRQQSSKSDVILDFGQIFTIIRKGWWITGVFGLLGALTGAIIAFNQEPVFSARAQILMGQKSRPGGALAVLMQDLNLDDDAISGEIAIINSGRLLSKVTSRLDLGNRPEFNPALRPPEPEPSFVMGLVNDAIDGVKALLTGVEEPDATEGLGEIGQDPVTSAARVGKVSLGDQADFVSALQGMLYVQRVGNSNLIEVGFTSTDRMLAAAVPNSVVETYLEDQLDRKFLALRRVTSRLETRLEVMRQRLEASEQSVIDYRNRSLRDGFASQKQLDQQLTDLTRRLGDARSQSAEQASELDSLQKLISDSGALAAGGLFGSDFIDRTLSQISELRQRQTRIEDRYGAESKNAQDVAEDVARLSATVEAEVMRLRDLQSNRVKVTEARVEALRQQLVELETRAIAQAERDLQLAQFERDYEAKQTVYNSFLDKFTQTNEVADLQEGDALITSYADPPPAPFAPNKKLSVALGGIAGGFAGLALVFLRALTDSSVRSVAQLRDLTGGAAAFVQPRVSRLPFARKAPLVGPHHEPGSALAESVRTLRSHLLLSGSKERRSRLVISVTSSGAGCGKTATALLLARSIAQMGLSVVVVDADLRSPTIGDDLSLPGAPGLSEVLRGTVPLASALQGDPGSSAQILAARPGQDDPSGLLLSEAMVHLLRDLRKDYQVVILNTAPLSSISEAAPMVRMSDVVVMVVEYGSSVEAVEDGLDVLGKTGSGGLCSVLSCAPRGLKTTGGYPYGA